MDSLGDRIKKYELDFEQSIPDYLPFIVRLDGKNFSTFTKGFLKPFDTLFQITMIKTMNDLITKFNVATGYTHSDEITLIFGPSCTKEDHDNDIKNRSNHLYNGRIMKITSLLAGYCSARFNFHIVDIIAKVTEQYNKNFIEKVNKQEQCFDSRILVFPYDNPGEITNHMIWRSIFDSNRNTTLTYGRHYFGDKKIHCLNTNQIREKLKSETGIVWDIDIPIYFRHGVYAKKELYEKETEINGQIVKTMRQKIVNKSFVISFSDSMTKLLIQKHWIQIGDIDFFDIKLCNNGDIIIK